MSRIRIELKGYDNLLKQIRSLEKDSAKVVNRTIGDFKSRGPGWVSQEVTKEYNIKKKDVNERKKGVRNAGKVRVGGVALDNLEIIYAGRKLTPTHFQMKPTVRPIRNAPYVVSARIRRKEGRKVYEPKVFLAHSGGSGSAQIPFQRVGTKRLPIEAIKEVSVPDMIEDEIVSRNIRKRINEELGKRLDHNLNQIIGKRR